MNLYLTLLFITNLMLLIKSIIINDEIYSNLHYFIKGLGVNHLNGVFPSELLITNAINHERNRILSNNIISNNQLEHFVSCIDYHKVHEAIHLFKSKSIDYTISYHSNNENIYCFYLFLNLNDIEIIMKSEISFKILEPIPSIVKLDRSIHELQYSLLSNDTLRTENENNLRKYHPMVIDAMNGERMTLSIMLKPSVSKTKQSSIWFNWINSFKKNDMNNIDLLSNRMFWYDENMKEMMIKKTDFDILSDSMLNNNDNNNTNKSKLFKFKSKQKSDNKLSYLLKSSLTKTHYNSLMKAFHYRYNSWKDWSSTMNLIKSLKLHNLLCGIDKLKVENRNNNIIVYLPTELLTFTKYDTNNDKVINEDNIISLNGKYQLRNSSISGACIAELISLISSDSLVTRVSLSRPIRVLNNNARQITQGGQLGSEPLSKIKLDGTGVVIGISDTGIDENSCYFRDNKNGKVRRADYENTIIDLKYRKVIQYVNFSGSSGDYISGHGSHTSGTLAGYCAYETNNDANNVYKGMASGAKLAFFDIGVDDPAHDLMIPNDLDIAMFGSAYKAGARIHSNSWGGGNFYDSTSLDADKFMYEKQDFLIVFAAGNSGSSGSETILSPGISKNVLTVACTNNGHSNQNLDNIASFSSQGPTLDGRLKPDIAAPGNAILSVLANSEHSSTVTCATTSKQGTSMATPVVAGSAALLLQYFQDATFWATVCNKNYDYCRPFSPSSALLKALLLQSGKGVTGYDGNGAVHLKDPPDNYQGYGRIYLQSILNSHLFVDQSHLAELTKNVYTFKVDSTSISIKLKVTLSWNDPPNEAYVAKFLLHDLDLLVIDPKGNIFYGNGANSNGRPALGSSRDEVNNNEQVSILNPILGNWIIEIQAKRLTESDVQNYAIVISGEGIVSSIIYSIRISPSVLEECIISTGKPSSTARYELDVAKWSRVNSNGWSPSDSYIIEAIPDSSLFSQTNYFSTSFQLEVDKQCLPSTCYKATLHLSSNIDKSGRQLSIPQCDVFLAPLSPTADFCIDPPNLISNIGYNTSLSDIYVPIFNQDACKTSCELNDHIKIPLVLTEYYSGVGWSGHYYVITTVPTVGSNDPLLNSFAKNSYGAGNMEFDLESVVDHCLPVANECYVMQLSISSAINDDTEVVEDPQLYFISSYDSKGQLNVCENFLDSKVTLAKFCISTENAPHGYVNMDIDFYKQAGNRIDFGQKASITWAQFVSQQAEENIKYVGNCKTKYSIVTSADPTINPAIDPTSISIITNPTINPSLSYEFTLNPTTMLISDAPQSTVLETNIPSIEKITSNTMIPSMKPSVISTENMFPLTSKLFGNHSFECFTDCPNYPGAYSFLQDKKKDTCYFLLEIYHLCSTFNVAYGLCPILTCAIDCLISDWCYFGAGTVISCPDMTWQGSSYDAIQIQSQCINSLEHSVDNKTDDNNDSIDNNQHPNYSKTKVALLFGVLCLFIMILIVIIIRSYIRSNDSNILSASEHSILKNIDNPLTNNQNLLSNAISNNMEDDTKTPIKDIINKSVNYMKEKIKYKNKKNITKYEAVKSPFSIIGEEEDDDDIDGDYSYEADIKDIDNNIDDFDINNDDNIRTTKIITKENDIDIELSVVL